MKKIIPFLITAIILSSCADDQTSSEAETSQTTAATVISTTSAPKADIPEKKMRINVDVVSYKDEQLTFTYNGKNYTLPMERSCLELKMTYIGQFTKSSPPDPYYKMLPEKIIDNKLGEKISAVLTVDEAVTEISECDVITPNGKLYVGYGSKQEDINHDGSTCYKFRRTGSTACEFYNDTRTISADLNDLPSYLKMKYPSELDDIFSFEGYLFKDGKFILNSFSAEDSTYYCEELGAYTAPDHTLYLQKYNKTNFFFAVVQKATGDKATIILNDGKTVCTAPTYYSDGEITEGMPVIVMLDEDVSLFGSGEKNEYDFAVFISPTDLTRFEEHAYAVHSQTTIGKLDVTDIRQLEKGDKI